MFKHVFRLLSLFLVLFTGCSDKKQYPEIKSFSEVQHLVEQADADTLVVFDCDDTIYRTDEKFAGRPYQAFWSIKTMYLAMYAISYFKPHPTVFRDGLFRQICEKSSFSPVEPSMITTIQNVCARGGKVIALTAQGSGAQVGSVSPRFEAWRYDSLKTIGIDFSKSFDVEEMTFDQFPPSDRGRPVFYRGILCSSDIPKGMVLSAFLDKINYTPKKVIFIDDLSTGVESVGKAMAARAIPYQGFVYYGATTMAEPLSWADVGLIWKQFKHMVWTNTFISTREIVREEVSV